MSCGVSQMEGYAHNSWYLFVFVTTILSWLLTWWPLSNSNLVFLPSTCERLVSFWRVAEYLTYLMPSFQNTLSRLRIFFLLWPWFKIHQHINSRPIWRPIIMLGWSFGECIDCDMMLNMFRFLTMFRLFI